jgi:hypothetical protein
LICILLTCIWCAAALPGFGQGEPSKKTVPPAGVAIDRDLLAGVEDRAPVRSADQNYYEYRAYNYLFIQAHQTPALHLADNARRDLTFAHLFEEPDKYRGELVHVEGMLRRLRRFDASRLATKQGVPTQYEGWIFGDVYYNNPLCVIASEIDPAIEIGERVKYRVSFDGYFFKRYRYKGGDSWRDAPLLIGRIISLQESSNGTPQSTWSFNNIVMPMLLTAVIATAGLCIGLTWWFRRGDRQVHARLERIRSAPFADNESSEGAENLARSESPVGAADGNPAG